MNEWIRSWSLLQGTQNDDSNRFFSLIICSIDEKKIHFMTRMNDNHSDSPIDNMENISNSDLIPAFTHPWALKIVSTE